MATLFKENTPNPVSILVISAANGVVGFHGISPFGRLPLRLSHLVLPNYLCATPKRLTRVLQ
ncbi:hypothetical protein BBBOND_0306200 [Babesia bigemina]|uniref:Uncharacterized protein n=1 Tax=Babesia bigemina TaxID=5866 RepID=A0A061D7Q0_BABBI|nr:hypothetical protein BBBOND_0306200 [Babesia bigemina]CDR96716.1 hypothetical protein BBBOND_0306200 [Babesia bigemina]|eukprot:XP_012768902.1 hypothetical protein BBBOND_0306200 [Babesia bigemina]